MEAGSPCRTPPPPQILSPMHAWVVVQSHRGIRRINQRMPANAGCRTAATGYFPPQITTDM